MLNLPLTKIKKLGYIAGKEEAEMALQLGDQNAECHQWYVVVYFI